MDKTYVAIDLKSFYASVECITRGLDPLSTHLVVADASRTEKTICLAVSPSLKAYGIPGRARLFEVVEKMRQVNGIRRGMAPRRCFTGKSNQAPELARWKDLEADYIVAPPRMQHYMETSARIYKTYLKYVAPEDIHVYSIDEVFIDATGYLKLYNVDAYGFTRMLIHDVLAETGITATAGIGTNLYLCKVAMDIVAKHIPADEQGVRIAFLDEQRYREQLWDHQPLTDFWRVGRGTANRLERHGMFTMGDVARCSLGQPGGFFNEDFLYQLFGVNAELLIDHAWGYEPCTIAHIKAYEPTNHSVSTGQVLTCPYSAEKAEIVVREMADNLALELVAKGLVTDQVSLSIGYDTSNLTDPHIREFYTGPVVQDVYGRKIPKQVHGSVNLERRCASSRKIVAAAMEIFDRVVDRNLLVRRLNIGANIFPEDAPDPRRGSFVQLDLFADPEAEEAEEQTLERDKRRQMAMLDIKHRFGKNAILRGMSLREGATARERNKQIGGHKA